MVLHQFTGVTSYTSRYTKRYTQEFGVTPSGVTIGVTPDRYTRRRVHASGARRWEHTGRGGVGGEGPVALEASVASMAWQRRWRGVGGGVGGVAAWAVSQHR